MFWAGVLLVTGGVAGTLQVLGPVPAARVDDGTPAPPIAQPESSRLPPDQVAAPVAALLEPSKAFPPAMLPKVAADGRVARAVYARRWDATDARPRIALALTGLGMSDSDTKAAIQTLPGAVTLAFSPYGSNADAVLDLARKAGHELLISIPMEPQGFPLNDAGSHSLLTGALPAQNAANLEWVLGRVQGYAGAVGALDAMRGERFAEQTSSYKAMLDDVTRRGLLYLDPRPGRPPAGEGPIRGVDLVVDDPPARAEIEAKLAALERLARERGSAIGLAGPLRPVTVERVAAWSRSLGDRGIVLVPVSALVPAGTATAAVR